MRYEREREREREREIVPILTSFSKIKKSPLQFLTLTFIFSHFHCLLISFTCPVKPQLLPSLPFLSFSFFTPSLWMKMDYFSLRSKTNMTKCKFLCFCCFLFFASFYILPHLLFLPLSRSCLLIIWQGWEFPFKILSRKQTGKNTEKIFLLNFFL